MSALVKVRPPPLNSISPVTEMLGLPSLWFTEMTDYVYLIPTVVSLEIFTLHLGATPDWSIAFTFTLILNIKRNEQVKTEEKDNAIVLQVTEVFPPVPRWDVGRD